MLEEFVRRVHADLLHQEAAHVIDLLLADASVLLGNQGKQLHQGLQDLFAHE